MTPTASPQPTGRAETRPSTLGAELGAVLWDMDGTLIDSQPLWIESQARLAAEFGSTWTKQDGLRLVGVSMATVARALQEAGVRMTAGEIIPRLSQEVAEALERRIAWRPGVPDVLESVRAAGIRQVIVTSAPGVVPRVVAAALPRGAISAIVAAEDVTASKPDPEPFLKAAEAVGLSPQGCLAVEDSQDGLASAVAAGMPSIGVPHNSVLDPGGPWHLLQDWGHIGAPELRAIHHRLASRFA